MIEQIIHLAKIYGDHRSLSLATVSTYAANDGKLFRRFEAGAGCTVKRAAQLVSWFSENWPSDLEWPRSIPRPRPNKKEAA